jgi:virginiamycin B lyase
MNDYRTTLWFFIGLFSLALSACSPGVEYSSQLMVPTANSGPAAITCDRYQTVWFTESAVGKIGSITQDNKMTEYSLPSSDSRPEGIEGEGDYVWFTEAHANMVGRIQSNGSIREFKIPTRDAQPYGILGSDDGAWFVEKAGNRVGHVNISGRIIEYVIPTPNSQPMNIAENYNSDTIWFTEFRGNKIGEISHNGRISEYPLPRADSAPAGLVYQYWGTHPPMWIAESGSGRLASISQQGRITEVPVPGYPNRIVALEYPTFLYGDAHEPSVGLMSAWSDPIASKEKAIATNGGIGDVTDCNGEIWATDPELNEVVRIDVYVPSSL